MNIKTIFISLLFYWALFPFASTFGKSVPTLTSPVIDETGVLSPGFQNQVRKLLIELNQTTGIQFQIYFFNELEDENIESYSIKVTDAWKLGSKNQDKGLLFILSLRDRKMRLEVGQGLEGELTDLYSKRILDSLRPHLKEANYEGATLALIDRVLKILNINIESLKNIDTKPVKKNQVTGKGSILIFFIFLLLTLIQRFFPVTGRHYRGQRRPFDIYYGGGYSGGGNRGHSSSSWSGGGGGFSGGGASGDW